MISKRLWHCLIGSTLLHITLLLIVARMSPRTPVTMCAIEAFVIESPVARLVESKQSIPTSSSTDNDRHTSKMSQLQSGQQGVRTVSPLAHQNVITRATPSNEAPVLTSSQPAQSTTPASVVLNSALISQLSVRQQDENQGSKSSVPSRQSSGTGQVMALGEIGSPRFIHRESPVYPFMARKLGKEGKVVLRLALDAKGQLQEIDIVEANGFGFAEAASDAIRKSTFSPAVKNGRAISSRVLIPLTFVLYEGQ